MTTIGSKIFGTIIGSAIFFGVGVEIIYSLEKVAQWLQSQRALERRPSNFLRLVFPPERV